MKNYLIPCLLVLSFGFVQAQDSNFSQSEDTEWLPKLLIFSGSDWCKPCIKLKKEVITTTKFQEFAKTHVSIQEVDFPYKKANRLSKEERAKNDALAARYNPNGIFPSLILIDAAGNEIANLSSRDTKPLIEELEQVLNE